MSLKNSRVYWIMLVSLGFGLCFCIVSEVLSGPAMYLTLISLSLVGGVLVAVQDNKKDINSMTDPLTGIWNRGGFDKLIPGEYLRQLRSDNPQEMSLLILDIDEFKLYNDCFGHQAGDVVLQKVAKAMQHCANRPADEVFRHGGEEFSVLLPDTDIRGCLHIAENIRQTVEKLAIEHSSMAMHNYVTISIGGVTVSANETIRVEDVIEEGDDNMYKSKHNGRNKVTTGSM